MTAVLAVAVFVAICLVIKHAPYRWLQDRPPAPPLAGQRPHPTSPGGGANPHADRSTP